MRELGFYEGEPVKNILVRNKSGGFTEYLPVVNGRWIAQDETFTHFMCSACESKNHRGGDNYCPNCGAKMDLED